MPPSSLRRRGAPLGNTNNLKHGFYSRRLKKHDLSGVENTTLSSLSEEVALIRVYTRRVLETFDPSTSDFYENAELLRVLCLAAAAITSLIRAHALVSVTGSNFEEEITAAIRQVNLELRPRVTSPSPLTFPPEPPEPPDLN